MNRPVASTPSSQSVVASGTLQISSRRTLCLAAALLAVFSPAVALSGGQGAGDLQQKLAAVKQAAAENQQKLHKYRWTETIQLNLKGDDKPPSENLCQYGPDGKVQKTPIGPPPHKPRAAEE